MVLLDELRVTMSDYRKDLKELYEVLGIERHRHVMTNCKSRWQTRIFTAIWRIPRRYSRK